MSTYLEFELTTTEYSSNHISVIKAIKSTCKSLELDTPDVKMIKTTHDNVSLIRTQKFKVTISNLDGILALDFLKQLHSKLNELAVVFTINVTNLTIYT